MFDIGYNDHSIVERYITHKKLSGNCNYVFTFDRKYIVYERWTGKTFAYSVLNYSNDTIANIMKSQVQITKDMHNALVKKILNSKIYKFKLPNEPSELIDFIFRKIFPEYGYLVRENQIKLSINMFNGMCNKSVALCEAEVGTGKTYAYIIAGIVYGLYEVKKQLANRILNALADYTITYSIEDIKIFFVQRKNEEYFLSSNNGNQINSSIKCGLL
jgi:ATP-dependent DNA helicase DinG